MSITPNLIQVSSLAVGSPGTQYACTRCDISVEVSGPDQTSDATYRREQWTATCHAEAASLDAVAALWETICGHFAQRGQRVTLTTFSGSRVLPESGAPSMSEARSIEGYPVVSIQRVADQSPGLWTTFTVRAETIVPIAGGGDDPVEHDYTRTETEAPNGLITLTQRGRVRMTNGTSARDWVDAEIIDPAREAAGTANNTFTVRYTQGLDASVVEYEYTDADKSVGGGGLVRESRVEDRTSQSLQGRIVRTVSGYAEGGGAAAFAVEQEPAASPTLLQVRREISQPSVPDGRVTFTFEFLTGVIDEGLPGIIIFGYDETIEQVSGGRSALVQEYFDDLPSIRLGTQAPYIYTQQTTIEFTGAWEDHGITCVFDTAYLAREPSIRKSGGQQGLRRVSMSFVAITAEPLEELPDPRQIVAFAPPDP